MRNTTKDHRRVFAALSPLLLAALTVGCATQTSELDAFLASANESTAITVPEHVADAIDPTSLRTLTDDGDEGFYVAKPATGEGYCLVVIGPEPVTACSGGVPFTMTTPALGTLTLHAEAAVNEGEQIAPHLTRSNTP